MHWMAYSLERLCHLVSTIETKDAEVGVFLVQIQKNDHEHTEISDKHT